MRVGAGYAIPGLVALLLIAAPSGAQEDDLLDELLKEGPADEEASSEEKDSSEEKPSSDEDPSESASREEPEPGPEAPAERRAVRPPQSRLVEEIVVTAQKRTENLRDVPISIQAFSGELLDARGIFDQRDLQLVTPGLEIGTQVSYTTVYLRGVGTDAFLTADPSVATYIDGIYFPFAQGLAQDFGVVERVEVLKGPQGTLFGRNATGGALHIITEDPVFGDFSGQLNLTAATYPDFHSKANLNIPFGETLAVGLSGIYTTSEFYVTGTADGRPIDDDRSLGSRIKARWAPFDFMDATLSYFTLDQQRASTNFTLNRFATDLHVAFGSERFPNDTYEGHLDGRTFNNLDNDVFYGNVQFFTPWFDVKVLGSDQFIDTQGLFDFDGTDTPVISFTPEKNFADIQTAELQLISHDQSWAAEWIEWIGGFYYFQGRSGFDPIIGIFDRGELLLDIVGELPDPPAGPDPNGNMHIEGVVDTVSTAGFLQTTFKLLDWFDLTLGGRYQVEEREIVAARQGFQTENGPPIITQDYDSANTQDGGEVGPRDVTTTLSPKVALEFRPFADDSLFYFSFQEATKSATYNATVVTGPPTYAAPETLTAYEAGAKLGFLDGLVTLNTALFAYDIEDLQVQFLALTNGGVVSFENAEEAQIRGFELDTTTSLFPNLVDGLTLTGGLTWLKTAEYTSYPNAAGFEGNTGIFTRDNDFSGNRIVRSPEVTTSWSLGKTWDFFGGPLELTGDVYYNDGLFYEASNNPRSEQGAYHVLGSRLSYLHEDWNVRLTLFGRNLSDQVYSQGNIPNDFGNLPTIAAPRTVGFRARWLF